MQAENLRRVIQALKTGDEWEAKAAALCLLMFRRALTGADDAAVEEARGVLKAEYERGHLEGLREARKAMANEDF